ncbi:hypothetical protein [Gaetbulibacter sp. PBL-D1]|uniref:hypothetical protein n=1 Tax=Gaetbulibacter sp. PBL-D1 TaxID=3422594 RepID=UPI003D2EA709
MTIQEIYSAIVNWVQTGIPLNVKSSNVRTLLTNITKRIDVQETGRLKIVKYPPNTSIDLEIGDRVTGIVENTFLDWAIYIGGNINLLSSYLIVSGPGAQFNPSENQYDTISGVDQLLDDQDNQTQGFNQYVADAGEDPTVESGEPAVYYYLGTTNGDLSDYIKLSNEEVQQLQSNHRSFKVKQISTTMDDSCSIGQILVQKNNDDEIEALLFDSNYTKYLERNKQDLDAGHNVYIELDNKTNPQRSLFKVSAISYSNVSNLHYKVEVSNTEQSTGYSIGDEVEVIVWNDDVGEDVDLSAYQEVSEKGVANGYASLDSGGKVPSSQLPSYVDDVLEFDDLASFPATGETGKIYVAKDTNKTYRWTGSIYVEISNPGAPTLDEVTTTGNTSHSDIVVHAEAALMASDDTDADNYIKIWSDEGYKSLIEIYEDGFKTTLLANTPNSNRTSRLPNSTGTLANKVNGQSAGTDGEVVIPDTTFETAYNNQVPQIDSGEIAAGTETTVRRFSPADVKAMIDEHASSGGIAPQLNRLEPISLLPSQTQNLKIYVSNIDENTTVTIESQTVNSVALDFDNNDVPYLNCSVTTGATEDDFDVTLNNGTEAVYVDALTVNLGEVFIPSESDWSELSNSPYIEDDGEFKITTYLSSATGVWNKEFDYTKDYIVRFKVAISPLGTPINSDQYQDPHIELVTTGGSPQFRMNFYVRDTSYQANIYQWNINDGWSGPNSGQGIVYTPPVGPSQLNKFINYTEKQFEFRIISQNIKIYMDNVLQCDLNDTVSQNLQLKINVNRFDVVSIKYIELP